MAREAIHTAERTAPRWRFAALLAGVFAISCLGLALVVEITMIRAGLIEATDGFGVSIRPDPDVAPGSFSVETVAPGSTAQLVGIRPGDTVTYDNPLEVRRIHRPGQRYGLTVDRGGVSTHHDFAYAAAKDQAVPSQTAVLFILNFLATISATLFAWLIIVRRHDDPSALCLGLMVLGLSLPAGFIPSSIAALPMQVVVLALGLATNWLIFLALPLAYYLSASTRNLRQVRFVWGGFAAAAILHTISVVAIDLTHALPLIGLPGYLMVPVMFGIFGSSIGLLIRNFPQASPEQRNRIKVIGTALALYFANQIMVFVDFFGWAPPVFGYAVKWAATLLAIAVPALLAYAVIQKGLFDFSFALNRTLVYGVVSLVLLCGFGLAEWAVDHLVPEEWHKAGPVYSAGIALALFLAFHRVRDFVEHRIEKLFFRAWHRNEAQLREFVRASAHYEKDSALAPAAVAELERFSGGATSGLHWRDGRQEYRRIAGAGPDQIDPDDPALVRVRADSVAVDPKQTGSAILASLILPIKDHGDLAGFFTLDAKPQSLGYRPDEVEVLEWAAQQIGLNLQSASARAMRARTGELELRVKELEAVLAKLAPALRAKAAT